MLTDRSVIVAAAGIESADLDGEAVLLDVNSGLYYGLSGVGARIMEIIRVPTLVSEILDTLVGEYDVEMERLSRDVLSFLNDMQERNLIREHQGEVA